VKLLFRSAWILTVFGLILGASALCAQENEALPAPAPQLPPRLFPPEPPSSYPPSPDVAPLPNVFPGRQLFTPAYTVPPNPGPRQPLHDCLRKLDACCWSHLNYVGCGNCKSECTFIFGSCHAFYGEPCRKGPPPFAVPPGYGYPPQGANPWLDGYAPQGCGCE
jgi:hypothetical protein